MPNIAKKNQKILDFYESQFSLFLSHLYTVLCIQKEIELYFFLI